MNDQIVLGSGAQTAALCGLLLLHLLGLVVCGLLRLRQLIQLGCGLLRLRQLIQLGYGLLERLLHFSGWCVCFPRLIASRSSC